MSKENKVDILVAVNDHPGARFSQIVKELEKAGLTITQSLEPLGTVVGSIAPEQVDALSSIRGVTNVEASRNLRIAPPDSKIQ
jgi:hypothetical protein